MYHTNLLPHVKISAGAVSDGLGGGLIDIGSNTSKAGMVFLLIATSRGTCAFLPLHANTSIWATGF
jgi:hypothetical protein